MAREAGRSLSLPPLTKEQLCCLFLLTTNEFLRKIKEVRKTSRMMNTSSCEMTADDQRIHVDHK
ncbi:MAG: hypothetical protein C4531_14435 [Desulfurivibrio sp.]|nr:MAG: hypothetical protein C4531_14435 [Desulfurivibrio sp.]